ncbi:MAG: primosomal protein N', partial [Pyrinomonadaceae bacterium]
VTGSGKTEVYIRAMRNALEQGKTALMLVPEIALTPVFSRRLRSVFGDLVAIIHSSLSTGERFDEWQRIRKSEAKVVIGTRSAVFAPLSNLGVIVIDEEHDSSYRQHESPFYNGRDLAIVRANLANAVVVLGSATPALETFYNARNGRYSLLKLPNRIGEAKLPTSEVLDLRQIEKTEPYDLILSPPLRKEMSATLSRGEQIILLLNRRGFSQFVLCRSCGEAIKCENCDITLTYHMNAQMLVCHYCDMRKPKPETCPKCESAFLYYLGEGTEQIESLIEEYFPNAKLARVDRDSTSRKHQLEETLDSFAKGEIDILIGTQMLAKGHDFPNVTLVGVISADISLSLPDFRAGERTFQLITQVSGRAGRGDRAGKVLIQTFYPNNYVLEHAKNHDFLGFYEREIKFRERLFYPPFVALSVVHAKHPNFAHAFENASKLIELIKLNPDSKRCIVLGPARAPIERLRGEHRLQIIVKSRSKALLRRVLGKALADAKRSGCDMQTFSLEVDPVSLL